MRFFNEKKEFVSFVITALLTISFGLLVGGVAELSDVEKECVDIHEDVKQIEDYFVRINGFKSIIETSNITEINMSVDEFEYIFGVDDSLSEKVKVLQSKIDTIRESFANHEIIIFLSISAFLILLSIIVKVVFYDVIEDDRDKK